MELVNSITRLKLTQFINISIFLSTFCLFKVVSDTPKELFKGFKATPNPQITKYQPILSDINGNYSLSFLRVENDQLSLGIIHVASFESIWVANLTRFAKWADPTELFFNGSLVLSDPSSGVFWSTHTDGDRVSLSNTSNLQVEKLDSGVTSPFVSWQSFHFPSDTLVENQNFTSAMTLVSSNGLYSMSLGSDFFGLYVKLKDGPGLDSGSGPGRMYWKHKALEAKADVIEGQGPIYAVLKSDGFFGMYQNESVPVDVESFNSFQQPVSGVRRIRVEPNGNLKGYFWVGSSWVLDYQAIKETCELPSPCGSYGLCRPGKGCSCLDNSTNYNSGGCVPPENQDSRDFCGVYDHHKKYKELSRNGVELPNKELMDYQKMVSFQKCRSACEGNCTCWGVVYTNTSGFCYILDYPIQSLVGVGDESKMGFFKVREGVVKDKMEVGLVVGAGLLCGAILIFGGVIGLGYYRYRKRKRGVSGYVEDGMIVGPYKDLGNASFSSIELSER
ncbi:hypothetical protein K7X08_014225 [Anisodus acutangulus]|uniref:Apple domain-containing protein n=1 Tax=Anisodus acutangulus TaxID=402998 RepID=A0A9Q1R2P1_9SOLA|nr:hypothetical protein K7X08_014225 [Anisodus acutangulus]